MKQKNRLALALSLFATLALSWQACSPLNPDNIVWEPEFLGPIVYTVLDPVEIANAAADTIDYDSQADQLQIPNFQYNQSINTGPVGPVDLPEEFDALFDLFNNITVNSGKVFLWFENTWPIAVGAGSTIRATDSVQGILFEYTLQSDVQPGEMFETEIEITNKTMEFGFTIQWIDFQSPGGNNVTFQSGNDLVLYYDFELEDFTIAIVKPNNEYVLEDESTFEFEFEGDSDIEQDVTGTFSFFLENNLPSGIELEMKLLNGLGDTLYSFFNGQSVVLPTPQIDGNGYTVAPTEVDLIDAVDISDIDQLQDATQLYTRTKFITPASSMLVVDNDNYIRIQLTADVKIKAQ